MTEKEIAELVSMVKDFHDLIKSDDVSDYVHSCSCCGTYFQDDFDKKRQALRARSGRFFEVESEKWRWDY